MIGPNTTGRFHAGEPQHQLRSLVLTQGYIEPPEISLVAH